VQEAMADDVIPVEIGYLTYPKIPNRRTPFFKEENFSFFEDTKNSSRIIKLPPLNHRSDREY